MALQLTKNNALDFSGKVDAPVTLGISGANGVKADILATHYNGITQTAPPFQIKLATGENGLVVVFAAAQEGAQVSIQEVDAADPTITQTLAQPFFHKSIPNITILIRGQ